MNAHSNAEWAFFVLTSGESDYFARMVARSCSGVVIG